MYDRIGEELKTRQNQQKKFHLICGKTRQMQIQPTKAKGTRIYDSQADWEQGTKSFAMEKRCD